MCPCFKTWKGNLLLIIDKYDFQLLLFAAVRGEHREMEHMEDLPGWGKKKSQTILEMMLVFER
jgi:hypothetical protein